MRTIINKLDYARIQQCVSTAKQFNSISPVEADSLLNELKLGRLVEPEEIPETVVTMNSVVTITFLESGKEISFQLVYPDKADVHKNKISIFSPIATALLGYQTGDEIEWCVPAGMTKIKIKEIVYQPESAGHFNL